MRAQSTGISPIITETYASSELLTGKLLGKFDHLGDLEPGDPFSQEVAHTFPRNPSMGKRSLLTFKRKLREGYWEQAGRRI
jgi:hypothetical protein